VSGDTDRDLNRQEGVATMTYHQLTQEERYLITRCKTAGYSQRQIALMLGRAASTISRELRRNATTHDGGYRAEKAKSYAVARRRRCRRGPRFDEAIHRLVEAGLKQRWSPDQIVGFYRAQGMLMPSIETIYRRLREDKRHRGTLHRFTRILAKMGRKRYRSRPARGVLLGKPHITERPAEAEAREAIGHWEGDTVMGHTTKHCLLTLVERSTGYAVIKALPARTMTATRRAVSRAITRQRDAFKTITFDNGTEFHDYERLQSATGVRCFFATPYHSWERGSNENLNGLIRQYLPKRMCLKDITQKDCDRIAKALNTRPRKRYGYKTPEQMLFGP
jgi:IS30 family transposase